jgi:hypothetical protein
VPGKEPAARRQLANAQRLRHWLTCALPYLAVQARIRLIRVHLALGDLAGAPTLMREVDELLRRRPALGDWPSPDSGSQHRSAAAGRGVGGHRVAGGLPGMVRRLGAGGGRE